MKYIMFLSISILALSLFNCNLKNREKSPSEDDHTHLHRTADSTTADEEAIRLPRVNIIPDQKVSSPLIIEFSSLGIWKAFEGEVGTVQLVDDRGKLLNKAVDIKSQYGILSASDDNWMTDGDAKFKTRIYFDAGTATAGKLIFRSRAGGEDDRPDPVMEFEVPVRF